MDEVDKSLSQMEVKESKTRLEVQRADPSAPLYFAKSFEDLGMSVFMLIELLLS